MKNFQKVRLETLRAILDRLGLERQAADGVELGVAKLADGINQDWGGTLPLGAQNRLSPTANDNFVRTADVRLSSYYL